MLRGVEPLVEIVLEKENFQDKEQDGHFDQDEYPEHSSQAAHPGETVPVKGVDVLEGLHGFSDGRPQRSFSPARLFGGKCKEKTEERERFFVFSPPADGSTESTRAGGKDNLMYFLGEYGGKSITLSV